MFYLWKHEGETRRTFTFPLLLTRERLWNCKIHMFYLWKHFQYPTMESSISKNYFQFWGVEEKK
jgi:hypothetical protein